MKRFTLLFISVFAFSLAFSQIDRGEVLTVQNLFGKEKRAIVEEFIQANPASNDRFWGLYDAYEIERKELGLKRVDLLDKYTSEFSTLDDAQTDEIMKLILAQQKAVDKLIITYYKKLRKEVGVKQAAQFYQLEYYFLDIIRVTIFENIPFIGELDIVEE